MTQDTCETCRFWVSVWILEGALPSFEYHGPWWVSGYDMAGRASICAAVCATDEADAIERLKGCIDAGDLQWAAPEERFCSPQADDWSPYSDRFPQAAWMQWPYQIGEHKPKDGK